MKYCKFPVSIVSAIERKKVTSHRLFRVIQASFINTIHTINQSRTCFSILCIKTYKQSKKKTNKENEKKPPECSRC